MPKKMPPVLIWRIVLALIMLALGALVLIGKARAQVINGAHIGVNCARTLVIGLAGVSPTLEIVRLPPIELPSRRRGFYP